MAVLDQSQRLKKELTLLDVYAISLGATLSSGFFLLPGLAAAEAGPAVVITYLIALMPLIPGILCKAELATAMPRAGGEYYFLDRSLGPAFGTICGFGTWLALVLKVAFALVGIGAYLAFFWHDAPMKWLAVGFAVIFGVINWRGARKAGKFQIILVAGLLLLILWFVIKGLPQTESARFIGFFDKGAKSILSTAGLVCISYIGLTKVASIAEEVKNPEKNLPRGMFLAVITASLVYVLGTIVMVGVLPSNELQTSLRPVAEAAESLIGHRGAIVMTFAAVLAFFSVANAGILSASRYPLAMSRDHLVPGFFQRLGKFGTPTTGILITVAFIIIAVLVFDPLRIAKLAGAFQLLLFASNCVGVIVMRESRIESYDPGYRAPWYPWLQIVGIVAPFWFIIEMGWLPIGFTIGLFVLGLIWYLTYARPRVSRVGAIRHVFRRLAHVSGDELDRELRGILKEKGLREQDPFDESVARASVIDVIGDTTFERIVEKAAQMLAESSGIDGPTMIRGFLEGTRTGLTPVSGSAALPHLRFADVHQPHLVIVRCQQSIEIATGDKLGEANHNEGIHAIFFLLSPADDPGQHLRILAQLASRVDQDGFLDQWLQADSKHQLKEFLLRNERYLSLTLSPDDQSVEMIDRAISDLKLPKGSLVAVIRRGSETIVPGGATVLKANDRITIIGDERAIQVLYKRFGISVS